LGLTPERIDTAAVVVSDAYVIASMRNERETIAWLEHLLGDIDGD